MKTYISIKHSIFWTFVFASLLSSGIAQTRDDLFKAIEDGDAPKVAQILKVKPELANETDEVGFSPLARAAETPAVWKVLLANAAAVNSPPMTRFTVLESAVKAGDPELVEALIAKGSRVEDENTQGENVFHWLAYVNKKEEAKKIFTLIYAKAPKLIDKPVTNPNPSFPTGTPLWYAVDRINPIVAELLVKHGANPTKQPGNGASSAADFIRERFAEESSLRSELLPVAKAMNITP